MNSQELRAKIENRTATVSVIGLGYVGLPLVQTLVQKGYTVTGLEMDDEKVRKLNQSNSYIEAVSDQFLEKSIHSEEFIPTTDPAVLGDSDVIVICVPTPLNEDRTPNTDYIEAAAHTIQDHLRERQLIVLESTTYPGTTEELLVPILNDGALEVGEDVFVAYAPERLSPGNSDFNTANIPRVVSGIDDASSRLVQEFYQQITVGVISVDTPREAEASKLVENIYRSTNIALVNELKILFEHMDVDVWNVIEAAATKPFGFEPFYPGPGLGGHCLPIDPFFLSWKAEQVGQEARMVELSGEINTSMPEHIVEHIERVLKDRGASLSSSNALLLGMAYKENVADTRVSPGLRLFELLESRGARVDYHDPHVPDLSDSDQFHGEETSISGYPQAMSEYDFVLVVTAHNEYNPDDLLEHATLIFDARNLMGDIGRKNDNVIFV